MRFVICFFGICIAHGGAFANDNGSPGAASCKPPTLSKIDVSMRPQLATNWCWAASAQMIMEYLGRKVSQCVQANNRLHRSDCCNQPTPRDCDKGGWPQFELYWFSAKTTSNAPLSWSTIQKLLAPTDQTKTCMATPFAFSWEFVDPYDPGHGHMMVAVGYNTVNGINYITVDDPLPVNTGNENHYVR